MMKIPFSYIVRNFTARKLTAFITVGGIALVVFVFAAVLMMAYGIEKTLVATGSDSNVLVTRKSANGEISSIIDRQTANVMLTLPDIARDVAGKPLVTTDAVAIINLNKKGGDGGMSNVAVRGIAATALDIRTNVKLKEGRMFNWGARELVVGTAVTKRFDGASIGSTIKFAGDQWRIVGVMDGQGSGFDSEIWCDVTQVQQALNRTAFTTLTFKASNPDAIEQLKMRFDSDPRLNQFEPEIERRYFEKQSEAMSSFIRVLGIFITVIFSIGAVIGAMITMYAAVANRTTEIGTLRALGFRRRNILLAFLLESLLIAGTGGIVGVVLASTLQFFSISTLNFGSFSELEFSFALAPDIVISSLAFALVMGVVGGFLPALRAARLNIVVALKAG
jgi:ABC-type antimicrobial peptide transport system permease subunit